MFGKTINKKARNKIAGGALPNFYLMQLNETLNFEVGAWLFPVQDKLIALYLCRRNSHSECFLSLMVLT